MRGCILAVLSTLLVYPGSSCAQQFGSSRNTIRTGSAATEQSSKAPLVDPRVSPGGTIGLWASGEYLLWWTKNGRIAPVVTAGGRGVLGSPGARPLVDNLDFDSDPRQGARFALGYNFIKYPLVSIEADYFFLAERQSEVSFSSGGRPVLAQPFTNAMLGKPDATLVAAPRTARGEVSIATRLGFWGVESNLKIGVFTSDRFHLAVLGGFRFLRLEDEVQSKERFQVAPNVPGFGGSQVHLQDDFRTINDFYGGQIGAEAGVHFGPVAIDFRGKLALGQMQEVLQTNGTTDSLSADGTRTSFRGGLYALRSNIGRHQRNALAFIPEVGLNVGFQLTRHVKVFVGYTFLWVSTVARAGEQVDPAINVSQFPIRSGNGPLRGRARPAPKISGSDFWAQGLSVGLELKF